MVATLLKLKFALTIAEMRRSVARLVLWIVLGVYSLGMVALMLVGLFALSGTVANHAGLAASVTILAGSILVLGWTLLPLIFFGADQTLDPARFAQFPVTGRQLAPGLIIASLIGLPGLLTALVCLGMALSWSGLPYGLAAGLVAGVLGFLMTQIGCRAASAQMSGALSSRRARDMTGLIGLVVVLMLSMSGYAISMSISLFTGDASEVEGLISMSTTASQVLSWTPLGAPWALAGDVAQGQWLLAGAHFAVTAVYLAGGVWLYSMILDRALTTPARAESSAVVTKGDFIAKVAGWGWAHHRRLVPVAAITARCLRYWRRDPRYLGAIPAILLMPIMFTVMSRFMETQSGGYGGAVTDVMVAGTAPFGVGFMAIMTGYSLSSDVASDSTAWWVHLASGVRGWQDRLGRVVAQLVWAFPLTAVVAGLVPWIVGQPDKILASIGGALHLYLAGLAVASVFSALIIYPVALPGESPLKAKTGMMGSQMLSQFGCMAAASLLGAPISWWALVSSPGQGGWILLGGILAGLGLLCGGVILGGAVMDSRGPSILHSLQKNDSRERS